jgi:hypothetical protein
MAHFAELDKNNKVLRVIVIDNDVTHDENGIEQETLGVAFCKSLFGSDTNWVQTSFNSNMRNKFASMGDTFNDKLNVFIPAQPFSSWELTKDGLHYEAPIAKPNDGKDYNWNEATLSWVEETPLAIE